jgi:hypothetical protein
MRHRSNTSESSTPAAPACWQREAPSACLRVELQNGEIHLFAYQHFITALLNRDGQGTETARVTFSTHVLEIQGRGLRELLLNLQDFAVKWLRAAPGRYHALPESADGVITAIRVVAIE